MSEPRPRSNPRSKRMYSPSKKQRERVPIRFIEIERVPLETRDDCDDGSYTTRLTSPETQEESRRDNDLLALIEKRDWGGIIERLKTSSGKEEASKRNRQRDFPLHLLCQCGPEMKGIPKYGPIQRSSRSSYGSVDGPRSYTGSNGTKSAGRQDTLEASGRGEEDGTESLSGPSHDPKKSPKVHVDYPTAAAMGAVLSANRKAIRSLNSDGFLPLHLATRRRYPKDLLCTLIKGYPQGLDVRDSSIRTSREYAPLLHDIGSRAALLRPTSCWLQQAHDEDKLNIMDRELSALEDEVNVLQEALAVAAEDEQKLAKRMEEIEVEIDDFGDEERLNEYTKIGDFIQDHFEHEIGILRGKMEGLAGGLAMKFADEEKERACLSSFNNDMERIYKNANEAIEEMRQELETIAPGRT